MLYNDFLLTQFIYVVTLIVQSFIIIIIKLHLLQYVFYYINITHILLKYIEIYQINLL